MGDVPERADEGSLIIPLSEVDGFLRDMNAAVLGLYEDMLSASYPEIQNFENWINSTWGPFFREGLDSGVLGIGSSGVLHQANLHRATVVAFRDRFLEFLGEDREETVTDLPDARPEMADLGSVDDTLRNVGEAAESASAALKYLPWVVLGVIVIIAVKGGEVGKSGVKVK